MYELVEALKEQCAVGKAGQLVVIGEVVELVRLFDMIYSERDVAGQFRQ